MEVPKVQGHAQRKQVVEHREAALMLRRCKGAEIGPSGEESQNTWGKHGPLFVITNLNLSTSHQCGLWNACTGEHLPRSRRPSKQEEERVCELCLTDSGRTLLEPWWWMPSPSIAVIAA